MADRTKVWECILYPGSLPVNWLELLEKTHVQIAVSPLHDRDVWTESDEQENQNHIAGELKKSHYHVVLYFESLKTAGQALELLKPLGVRRVNPIPSPRTYNRYLAHLDQPNKAQYNPDEIIRLNGAECDISKPLTDTETQGLYDRIEELIDDEGITEYQDLLRRLRQSEHDLAVFVRKHTIHFRTYLCSARNKLNKVHTM